MTEPLVVCVLRTGGDFGHDHVVRLFEGLTGPGKWDGHFVCLTDEYMAMPTGIELRPLLRKYPGWWSKLEVCAPEQDSLGDILYLDLDTTVVGDLAAIAAVRDLTLLQDFLRPKYLASGVMYLPVSARQAAWKRWQERGAEVVMAECRRGDQQFFAAVWEQSAARWQIILPEQIVSFKVDVQGPARVPANARLVCFHGQPRPWDVPPL